MTNWQGRSSGYLHNRKVKNSLFKYPIIFYELTVRTHCKWEKKFPPKLYAIVKRSNRSAQVVVPWLSDSCHIVKLTKSDSKVYINTFGIQNWWCRVELYYTFIDTNLDKYSFKLVRNPLKYNTKIESSNKRYWILIERKLVSRLIK